MFEHKGTEEFDIGSNLGEFEYDFFTINGEDDFWKLINHYTNINKGLNFIPDVYKVIKNNEVLSPFVQVKKIEYNANINITFLDDVCIENKILIKQMIVNRFNIEDNFDTYFFYYIKDL